MKEQTVCVGGVEFTIHRKLKPIKHWVLMFNGKEVELSLDKSSKPKLIASLKERYDQISLYHGLDDWKRQIGIED